MDSSGTLERPTALAVQNSIFSNLPAELQLEIALYAASNSKNTALHLSLIAKRFHRWVSPILYRMVLLSPTQADLFLRTIQSQSDRTNILAHHVKKLCICNNVHHETAKEILRLCSGTNDLSLWVDYRISPDSDNPYGQILSGLQLRRLSIELEHFESLLHLSHLWMETLTHLEIIFWTNHQPPDISNLAKFSKLTYLALYICDQPSMTYLQQILSKCRNLKIIVIASSNEPTDRVWKVDPSIVFLRDSGNPISVWESQVNDDAESIWNRGENLKISGQKTHEESE